MWFKDCSLRQYEGRNLTVRCRKSSLNSWVSGDEQTGVRTLQQLAFWFVPGQLCGQERLTFALVKQLSRIISLLSHCFLIRCQSTAQEVIDPQPRDNERKGGSSGLKPNQRLAGVRRLLHWTYVPIHFSASTQCCYWGYKCTAVTQTYIVRLLSGFIWNLLCLNVPALPFSCEDIVIPRGCISKLPLFHLSTPTRAV